MTRQTELRSLLERGLSGGVFPGAQLAVRSPDVDVGAAVGRTAVPELLESQPVDRETRFDIASLTKALCTSVLLMQAVDAGRLALTDTIERWVPDLAAADRISIELLASHRAGLAAHRPFYETLWAEGRRDRAAASRRVEQLICREPLAAEPGREAVYSDLGYLLLGWILERALDGGLDELFAERVARPLGLSRTGFGPVGGAVAATERDESGRFLVGTVHDENARAIGGIAGHAGLFSTADEVMRVVRHLADVHRGVLGVVRPETVRRFWRPIGGSAYTLGWDTPTGSSTSGQYTTRGAAVGHLGFTGCSVWHDLARDVTIVLLSNRVHPTRQNERIRDFRPRLHDGVNEWLAERGDRA